MALIDVDVEFELPAHEKTIGAFGREIIHNPLCLPCVHFMLGFGMRNSGETASSVITDVSLTSWMASPAGYQKVSSAGW